MCKVRCCLFVLLCVFLIGCKREQRTFTTPPATFKSYDVTMSDLRL